MHCRALQQAHCRCAQDPPIQQWRGYGADLAALCEPVQPAVAAVSAQEQNTDAGYERVVAVSPVPVPKMIL